MTIFKIVILLVVALIAKSFVLGDHPLQDWPSRFTQSLNETMQLGKFSIDYESRSMKIQRVNGMYERICSTYLPNVTTPCNHLVNNGTKYIVYPEKSLCCRCCNIEDSNCLFFRQDWLRNNTYTGVKRYIWYPYDTWEVNYDGKIYEYWILIGDVNKPGKIINRADDFYLSFFTDTYETSQIPKEVFRVPDYCNRDCPTSDYCSTKKQNFEILQ